MTNSARDFDEYVKNYKSLPFEPVQIRFRRRKVLESIERFAPRSLLEVGCGMLPLFVELPKDVNVTVVEPSKQFAANARAMAENHKNVQIIEAPMEDLNFEGRKFDMVILSCVLHEVADVTNFLNSVKEVSSSSTVIHINVPNALSLHRMLAVSMGLMSKPEEPSQIQKLMKQKDVPYSLETLTEQLEAEGFYVFERGTLFVKPFTHPQMQALIDSEFLTDEILDGLYNLVNFYPDLGSEIWVHVRSVNDADSIAG